MSQRTRPDLALAWLRITTGAGMALGHGWPKLRRLLDGDASFADPLGLGEGASVLLAIFGELVCGVLVAVGLGTRAAVVPLGATMLVALLIVHADDPWGRKELAFMYLAAAVTLFLGGGGRWAADTWVRRRWPRWRL